MHNKYKILSSTGLMGIQCSVNQHLDYNWELVGGVSVVFHAPSGIMMYYQAVAKKSEVDNEESCDMMRK